MTCAAPHLPPPPPRALQYMGILRVSHEKEAMGLDATACGQKTATPDAVDVYSAKVRGAGRGRGWGRVGGRTPTAQRAGGWRGDTHEVG